MVFGGALEVLPRQARPGLARIGDRSLSLWYGDCGQRLSEWLWFVDESREIGSFTAWPRRDKKGESTAVKAWLIDGNEDPVS